MPNMTAEEIRIGELAIRFLLEGDESGGTAALFEFTVPSSAMVPVAHSRHTAAIIPTAELLAIPDHGHISVMLEAPGLVDRLAALR